MAVLAPIPRASASPATVPPNNPVGLQSLKLIDFHLLRWSAQQRLFCVLGALTSMLKTSAQLRLENLALRQQLAVLRRSAPKLVALPASDVTGPSRHLASGKLGDERGLHHSGPEKQHDESEAIMPQEPTCDFGGH
jgi:hypothetical protein